MKIKVKLKIKLKMKEKIYAKRNKSVSQCAA